MIFAPPLHRVVEQVDRRVLGGFEMVDAVTRLPVVAPARVEVIDAVLIGALGQTSVALSESSVRIQQNRSGRFAILRAPFFDNYTASFDDPPDPPETPPGTHLRLRLAVQDAGPHYLPRTFDFDLPRPLDRTSADNVFQPAAVELFRAPGALVLAGWSVLRVRVEQTGTGAPLPGVLVRVFRSPRGAADPAIGRGMSEWRGDLRGEALVAVADLPRFRPGAGPNESVFETAQAIQLEATRDPAFSGAPGQLPDVSAIIAATAPGMIRRRSDPPAGPVLTVDPATPFNLRAGQETAVRLTMS